MAWTVVFALAGSLLLTLTLTPVLASLFLKKTGREHEPRFVEKLRRLYLRALDVCFAHRRVVIAIAAMVMLVGALLATRLGGEFIPGLDEGDISISAIRPSSVAISEVAASTGRIERVLKRFAPDAITVVSRSGSPELATDVMGIELGDVFVILKPISDWTTVRTKGALIEKMNEALSEAVRRRIVVELNVRGRDVASFVSEAQERIVREVTLPAGYYIRRGGQFENLQAASRRLAVVVPLALALIFAMLYFTFGSLKPAALIYLNVPFAATGGVVALLLRGLPFSISAGVGFIALFGVAVLNGVVLMTQVRDLEEKTDLTTLDVLRRACALRMRPVLMTALVASLGFVPMAIATGSGAEVQRPLATVVIGGLLTSTALTLLVLPTVYSFFRGRNTGVPNGV